MNLFSKYFFNTIEKRLRIGFVKASGRNFSGKICVNHKGGSNKRSFIFLDFYRRINSYGFVLKIIRTDLFNAFLGVIVYENGLTTYMILSDNLQQYKRVFSGTFINSRDLFAGYSVPLSYVPLFSPVSNIELYPFSGSIIARAAGTSAIITSKLYNKVIVKLNSGWNLNLSDNCICSIGQVSNPGYRFFNYKKAGRVRSLGIRPVVRGVAMNPCDHPHGGGEGKKSPPSGARSPWGWLTKGTPSNIKKYQLLKKKKFKYR